MSKINIGPMSKNIVDAAIQFSNETNISIALIASRRQVDYDVGYIGWDTKAFSKYVKERTSNIRVCRDHGGHGQGRILDDGIISFIEDSNYLDIIHVDPWKYLDLDGAIAYTIENINRLLLINPNCKFEIGTEQSIMKFDAKTLDFVFTSILKNVPENSVLYGVIQSGTSLKNGINIGNFDNDRLVEMIEVCKKHKLLSKEHNGDYLTPKQIKYRFEKGLDSINIAPEVAHLESKLILSCICDHDKNKWFDMCILDGSWKKWFTKDFDPLLNKDKLLSLCGHYVFTNLYEQVQLDTDYIQYELYKQLKTFILERIDNA